MEYRGSFLMATFMATVWVFLQVWIANVFFGFSDNILGWTKAEYLVMLGIVRIIKGFFDIFIRRNLFEFPEQITHGGLDYTLTRPVNSLFIMSLRYHVISEISTLITGTIILIYALIGVSYIPDLVSVTELFVLILCGLIAYYCVFLVFSTIAIFTTRLTAMSDVHEVVSQTMRYPTDIITQNNRWGEIFLGPFLIIATYPAKVFLHKAPGFSLFLEIILVAVLSFFTIRFWNFALRHYSSASS